MSESTLERLSALAHTGRHAGSEMLTMMTRDLADDTDLVELAHRVYEASWALQDAIDQRLAAVRGQAA